MSEVLKFKVSSAVAPFVRPGVTLEKKLAGIQMAPLMEPFEGVTLLFCLLKDSEPEIKAAAGAAFSLLPGETVLAYIQSAEAHPSLLNELARFHYRIPQVAHALLATELLSGKAREFLQRQHVATPVQSVIPAAPEFSSELCGEGDGEADADPDTDLSCPEGDEQDTDEDADADEDCETAQIDEDDEQFLSKYKISMIMGIGEKIKMAMSGDKEWRAILVKDTNKLVSASVIKNPRITEGEILTLVKVGVQNDEILRLICANREWVKNYLIRKALVCCPKTPLPNALRYLATLTEKDIAFLAKSKNIPTVLSTQAKRILLSKKR